MSLPLAIVIIVATTSAAIAVMLFVRRHAPDGGFFNDGDRAAGVFGVLATGFAVLLGFVVFLAFTTYDAARSGAEAEAEIVAQQVETAQLFRPEIAKPLSEGLVCYARSVAGAGWDLMAAGLVGDNLNPWAQALFQTMQDVEPQTPSEEAAYAKWFDERSAREAARQDRLHGVDGVIPELLWLVMFFISGVIFLYMLFFADSGERAFVQAMLMGSVVAVLSSMLILLWYLNNPYHGDVGSLKPVAMERALRIIDQELATAGLVIDPPCDARGNPS